MKRIAVSIVMPAFNSERFIAKSIESVLSQTFQDWELLIVDDGSKDLTFEIIQEYEKKDERIRGYQNTENLGVSSTRNRGFSLSQGDYIALLDSDDIWLPNKLEVQLERLQKMDADIVYCSYGMIDENGKSCHEDYIVSPTTNYEKTLIASDMSCSTTLLKKEIIEKYKFKTNYYHEDCIFWIDLMKVGYKAVGCQEVLAKYRIVSTSRSFNKIKSAVNKWRIYREYCHFSIRETFTIFTKYALKGIKKYR